MKHILIDDNYDGRIVRNFKALTESEEIDMVSNLTNYFAWFSKNSEKVLKEMDKNKENTDKKDIVEFWLENIVKPKEVEEKLKSVDVLADVFKYTEKYFEKMVFLKTEPDAPVKLIKNHRTKKQADQIEIIFRNHKENAKVNEIINYLNRKKLTVDDLNFNQAKRIIAACNKSLLENGEILKERSYEN